MKKKQKTKKAGQADQASEQGQQPEGKKRTVPENLLYWMRTLYRESPGFVWLYLAGCGVAVGISLLGVYMPSVLVADITEGGSVRSILGDLAVLGGGLVCLYLLSNWLERTKGILGSRIGQRQALQAADLALETNYDNIERADFPEEIWQLVDRHMWSRDYNTGFLEAFAAVLTAVVGMTLYTGMLSGLSLWILLLVIAGTALNYVVGIRCNRWDARNRHKWMTLDYKMVYLSRSTSTYEASKDVHLYWMPPWLRKLFNQELKQRLHYTLRQQGNYFLAGAVYGFSQMVWEGAAYLYLIYLVCEGRLDAAGFVLYIGVVRGFAGWCGSIVQAIRLLHEKASYVEEQRHFFEKLQRGREKEKEGLVLAAGHVPEISFEHVTFRYEGAQTSVLQDLNLTLKPGENVALVGLNGAGKTTFIKLLCGFYDPTEGKILIDGVDRSRYSKDSWLKYFSGVFQDAEFFPLSLEENLALGENLDLGEDEEEEKAARKESKAAQIYHQEGEPHRGKLSDGQNQYNGEQQQYGQRDRQGQYQNEESQQHGPEQHNEQRQRHEQCDGQENHVTRMDACLKMADLENKVIKLPKGLKTMFGKESYEDAADFSGGEMQKLMLARALYKEAPLLVLDEPTAALDPLMESELYQKYRRFSEHKTTVFISHRLASTRFCDRILLMEDGGVAESGTHEELLERDGKYAWMFRLQSKYYQKKEAQKEAGLEGEEVDKEI